jgi:hypothetical protein
MGQSKGREAVHLRPNVIGNVLKDDQNEFLGKACNSTLSDLALDGSGDRLSVLPPSAALLKHWRLATTEIRNADSPNFNWNTEPEESLYYLYLRS